MDPRYVKGGGKKINRFFFLLFYITDVYIERGTAEKVNKDFSLRV